METGKDMTMRMTTLGGVLSQSGLAFALVAALALCPATSRANTYYVTTNGTSSTGTGWGDAFGSIQAALNAVYTAADPTPTVYIAKTTYPMYAPASKAFTNSVALQLLGGYDGSGTPGLASGMSEVTGHVSTVQGLNLSTTGGTSGHSRTGRFTVANLIITNVNNSALYTSVVQYDPVNTVISNCTLSTTNLTVPVVNNALSGNDENDGAIINSTIYTTTGNNNAAVSVGDWGSSQASWLSIGLFRVVNSTITAAADGGGGANAHSRSAALYTGNNSLTMAGAAVTNLGAGCAVNSGLAVANVWFFTNFVNNCTFDSQGSAVTLYADKFTNIVNSISNNTVVQNSTFTSRGVNGIGLLFYGFYGSPADALPDIIISNVNIAATNSGGVGVEVYKMHGGGANVLLENSTVNGMNIAVSLTNSLVGGNYADTFIFQNNKLIGGSQDGTTPSAGPVVYLGSSMTAPTPPASGFTFNNNTIQNGVGGIFWKEGYNTSGNILLINTIITKQSGYGVRMAGTSSFVRNIDLVATNCTFSDLSGPAVWWDTAKAASAGKFYYCAFAPGDAGGNTSATIFSNNIASGITVTISGNTNAFYAYGSLTAAVAGTSYAITTSGLVNTKSNATGSALLDASGYGPTNGISPLVNVYKLNAGDPTNDVFGTLRPQGIAGKSDIGAVEFIDPGTPFVNTVGATNLTISAADLVGNLTNGSAPVDVVCYWGLSDGLAVATNWGHTNDLGTKAVGLVTNSIYGLAQGTTYFFRYWASNGIATAWAPSTMSFTTLLPSGAPLVNDLWATNITTTSAGLVGALTNNNAGEVLCYWGPGNGGQVAGNWAHADDLGWQTATVTLTNTVPLSPNTTYFFCYCATNGSSTNWALNPLSFTTLGGPAVNNGAGAANITANSALLQGNVTAGTPAPNVWIYWGAGDGVQDKSAWGTNIPLGVYSGSFSSAITNLLANKTYSYSCYASNGTSGAWAPASSNFTTLSPTLTIGSVTVTEGVQGTTTNAVLSVTLNVPSATSVSVNYTTADGAFATAGTDYNTSSGTLTIPAGVTGTQLVVSVIGQNYFSPTKTIYMDLSGPSNVTLANTQGVVTVLCTNFTVYVRANGNDGNRGDSWSTAWQTLQHALDTAPYSQPFTINVEDSSGSQSYAVCSRTPPWYLSSPPEGLYIAFQGGWQNVDTAPVQTGMSVVQDVTSNHAGILLGSSGHNQPKTITINRFAFTNVTRAVELDNGQTYTSGNTILNISNSTVRAMNDGLYVNYPFYLNFDPDPTLGGGSKVTAVNVDIVAGLGGAGHGISVTGWWNGSFVGATPGNVSSITSSNGCGICFQAIGVGSYYPAATFSNVVTYGCSSNAIQLDAAQYTGYRPAGTNYVTAVLGNCTLANNVLDGVNLPYAVTGSSVNVTNSIFAGNRNGVNLAGTSGDVCKEGYNVFFNHSAHSIQVNGALQTPTGSDFTSDPLFYAQKTKPSPWYELGSKSSPAYHSGTDGEDRGAYQVEVIASGAVIFLR